MMWILLIFFTISDVFSREPHPFASDGCTLVPDGTFRDPDRWRDCCVGHDLRLWGGGTNDQRLKADEDLRSCLKERANPLIAQLYFLGVRLGARSPWKISSKKWGNAWGPTFSSRRLSQDEIQLLLSALEQMDLSEELRFEYRQLLLDMPENKTNE
jgi:hypothetical protein